jgi:hypothetical protein
MMKRRKIISAILLVLLTVALGSLAGCKKVANGDSVDDCMSKFKTAVNSKAWGDLKALTSEDATMYNLAGSTTWSLIFTGTDFTYTTTGSDAATALCSAILYNFELTKDSDDNYRVRRIKNTATGLYVFQ